MTQSPLRDFLFCSSWENISSKQKRWKATWTIIIYWQNSVCFKAQRYSAFHKTCSLY